MHAARRFCHWRSRGITPRASAVRNRILSPEITVVVEQRVKRNETRSYDAFCADSFSPVFGSLIQATVGSFGGWGRRWRNLAGLVA